MLLVTSTAALGSGTRADRTTRPTPDAVPAAATAVQAPTTTYVRHQPVTVNGSGSLQLAVRVSVGVLGVLGILAALRDSKPLLRRVMANPMQTAD
ncbi:hypothetical protein [Streptomyces sp. UG1]|uniref:hypothetical protein n=1 Tax=Streptomyces sp. UG1 TaxID=3417652 RepID=UPI003CF38222